MFFRKYKDSNNNSHFPSLRKYDSTENPDLFWDGIWFYS